MGEIQNLGSDSFVPEKVNPSLLENDIFPLYADEESQ